MAAWQPTRREVLATAGGGLLAAVALAGCRSTGGGAPTADATPGLTFAQPEALTSAGGRLAVTLTAEARQVPYGSGTRYALTYNGTTPGPTLRVRPGDRLVVTLVNRLPADTNLHTHGLHVSPSGDADDIFVKVPPGGSHTYTYDIPTDHRSGLFWYHPHVHGHVAGQLSGGLAGAIVVLDTVDDGPELRASTERVLVLADPAIGTGAGVLAVSQMTRMQGREGPQVLVNGIVRPTIPTAAGMLERWRIVNASASRYYRLAVDGHPMHVIASDGGRLAVPVAVDELLLAPGERTELLVAPTTAGAYALRTLGYDRGAGTMGPMGGGSRSSSAATLATMTVTGSAAAATLPTQLGPDVAPATTAAATSPPDRTLVLAMGMAGRGMGGGMGSGGMGFTIDGRTFDPARVDLRTRLGTTEDWVVRNTSAMDHPFHLHVWPFQVVDGPATGAWKDTVNVPANGHVRIRVRFRDHDGITVYHCHILDHEDLGMMGVIEVSR